jgi:hypothetical protein
MYSTNRNIAPNEYKIIIAQNSCYEIMYESVLNRIYLTVKGFWKNKEAVPEYLEDVQKALKLTQPGFSLLSDMSTMITHPQRLSSLHLEVHKLLKQAGLTKAASVEPTDRIATLQVEDICNKSQFPCRVFASCSDAEVWLNAQL